MNNIKLDGWWSISLSRNEVILRYEEITEVLNKKTGDFKVKKEHYFYPNIELALKAYIYKSAVESKDISEILTKIEGSYQLIESLFTPERIKNTL